MKAIDFQLSNTIARYLIDDDQHVALRLVPARISSLEKAPWEVEKAPFNPRDDYNHDWQQGTLVNFHLSHQQIMSPGLTMRSSFVDRSLRFIDQAVRKEDDFQTIVTTLKSAEGYVIEHALTYRKGLRGLEISTTFINESDSDVELELLSSFVLDGLSPFQITDAPNTYRLHRFLAGWSLEGKHQCMSIEDLGLEKSWVSWLINDNCEKFGSYGSYPVERYFPTAVFEDTEHHVFWAAQLAHNGTWQMELGRVGNYLALSGGLGDRERCGWKKRIACGERFTAPTAYVAAVEGTLEDACSAITDMQKPAYRAYGEQGIPTSFNEYCATWGTPTQEKMLNFCNCVKDFGVKYLVIDAGWCKAGCEQAGNGEWEPDLTIFPDMKAMNDEIRRNGMIPGIWFEMEVTTQGSRLFEADYDEMKLKRDGHVIKVNNIRSYWDFRRTDVRAHLYQKVIAFLKKYGFGYIKIDCNANIGTQVDGAESGAEGLRQHLEAVRSFFELMKQEIPDLIIENCASGGHRSEPSMMGVSAITSFSDAHEAIEIPYIAASLHKLMLPAQELIWATLHGDDSDERLAYSLAATFLGRVCLSGPVHELNTAQRAIVKHAMDFYNKLTDVLQNGDSQLYGNRGNNTRHPTGTQVVVRRTDKQIAVVCHAFENPAEAMEIDLGCNAAITESFYGEFACVENGKLHIHAMKPFTAGAVLLTI